MNLVEELLDRVGKQRRRIVVIGDAMADRWVHGCVVGTCQEGCFKFVQDSVVEVPGGAANAERCLRGWSDLFHGITTSLHGCSYGDRSIKYRYVDADGRVVFRVDDDRAPLGTSYEWARKLALETVAHAAGVLLSDYDKGFLTPKLIRDVVDLCRERGIPCVADCKRAPESYAGCVLKCNEEYQHRHNDELSRLVYDVAPSEAAPLVVTAGALNPLVWDLGVVQKGFPLLPLVQCVNHVGAGDCFAAHLALALAYGFSLKEAAVLAHSAGRVYVQFPHNRPPTPQKIAADLLTAR